MMKALRPLMVAVGIAGFGPIVVAAPEHELGPKEAVKLIALMNGRMSEDPIAIATIVEGSKEESGKFEARDVRRVTAVLPVNEEGKRLRRVRCYDFYWNETYGWFVWEKRQGRGGEEVWIWSETEGDLVVK